MNNIPMISKSSHLSTVSTVGTQIRPENRDTPHSGTIEKGMDVVQGTHKSVIFDTFGKAIPPILSDEPPLSTGTCM